MEWKFTLGVGGAVVRDEQLLLVHHAYGQVADSGRLCQAGGMRP